MRVQAMSGLQLGAISDTILELADTAKLPIILKKLRKNGVSSQAAEQDRVRDSPRMA